MYDRYLIKEIMKRSTCYHVQTEHLNVIERKASLGNNLSGFAFLLTAAQFDIALTGKAEICSEDSHIW